MSRSGRGRRASGVRRTLGLGALLVCAAPLSAQLHGWKVDNASVSFEIRNAGLPVRGTFEGPHVRVCFDPIRPEAGTLSGTIDPATIRTGIGLRDHHLQRRGWFHVERYGAVEMRSVRLWKRRKGFAGDFTLRIRDVERQVVIPFAFERDGRRARLRGTTTIDRLDFGLGKPSVVLADDVTVELELTLSRGEGTSAQRCR